MTPEIRKQIRPKYEARTFRLVDDEVRKRALYLLTHAPIDRARPLQVVIREEPKRRKMDQNALMWAGPLADLAEQAWIEGRQYSAEVWHEYAKKQFLPEEADPELTVEEYQKWDYDPAGDRVLVGSTTQLTPRGFSDYLEQIYAFGANLGVQFTAAPSEGQP